MRIVGLTVLMVFVFLGNVMATSNSGIIRDLTIETMLNYANELNARGNYEESKNVMARIKQMSANQTRGLETKKNSVKASMSCCVLPTKVSSKPIEISATVIDPNADLKQAIAKEDRVLSELNRDVDMLRSQIQAAHHE